MISAGRRMQEGEREMEMQTERRGRKTLSSLVAVSVSGLEEKLETVSTATERPDSPALKTQGFPEISSIAGRNGKSSITDTTEPESTTIPRAEAIRSPSRSCVLTFFFSFFCLCMKKLILTTDE